MIAKHLAVAVLAASALLGGASAAAAGEVAPPSTLSLVPAKGSLDTPMNVVTSTWCPAGEMFTVAVSGKGIAEGSAFITGATPTEALLPYGDNQMNIPLSSTWKDFAADNAGGRLNGTYTIEVRCRKTLDVAPLARFLGKVRITASGYQAVGDAALPPEQQKPAPVPAASTPAQPSASAPAQQPSGQPSASASAPADASEPPAGQPSDAPSAAQGEQPVPVQAEAPESSARAAWWPLAVGAGAVLLLVAAWSAWRGRRSEPDPVDWDDVDPAAAGDDHEPEHSGDPASTPSS
jgi:hypothetical protein